MDDVGSGRRKQRASVPEEDQKVEKWIVERSILMPNANVFGSGLDA